jgi:raffinose/stachyose/melibiose transport system permease protein
MTSRTVTVARDAGRRVPRSARSPAEIRRRRLFYPFVLPALIVYLVFFIGPTLGALWISFTSWSGSGPMTWRGLRNYVVLVQDPVFHTAFFNTLAILVVVGAAVFVVSFLLTMVLRSMAGRRTARSVLFFPYMVSGIALSIIWGFIFQRNGLANIVITGLGGQPVDWLSADHQFSMIMLGLVWINVGLYTTIIMAGVDRIPPYFYEDSSIAGATAFQRFRFVTLPMTWDVVSVAAILWTIDSIKLFEFIFAFGGTTNDMPPTSVWNAALFVYGESFGGRTPVYEFGYASASAMLMLALFGLFVLILRRLMRREAIQF